jgi:hypothetical protein
MPADLPSDLPAALLAAVGVEVALEARAFYKLRSKRGSRETYQTELWNACGSASFFFFLL